MDIALYQILVPALCVVMVLKTFSHYFRKERTLRELVTLLLFWGGIAAIALFPDVTVFAANVLGIKSNVNALVFTMLGILCYMSFSLLISVENLEQVVTRLTRELALRDAEEKK